MHPCGLAAAPKRWVGVARPRGARRDAPDLDGFEVCRRLRDAGNRTPVLFLTARDGTDDKVRGLTMGGDDYLSKPFSLDELVARIGAVLRRTGAGRTTAACAAPTSRWTSTPIRPARRRVSLSPTEVQPAPLPAGQPGPGAVEGPDPRPRLASTTSGGATGRRGDLHRVPAPARMGRARLTRRCAGWEAIREPRS